DRGDGPVRRSPPPSAPRAHGRPGGGGTPGVAGTSPAPAPPSGEAVVAAGADEKVAAVVLDQLAALRVGDFASAYRHAAAGIKLQFPLESFERMVREGYAALVGWTACDVDA